MEVGYSRLVTISTDNMLTTNEYPPTGVGRSLDLLVRSGDARSQRHLDIAEYTDPEQRSDDSACDRARNRGLVVFKDLQRLLVFLADRLLKSFGRICAVVLKKLPSGLGPSRSRNSRPDWKTGAKRGRF